MRGRKPSFPVQRPAARLKEREHWHRSTTLRHGLVRRARVLVLLQRGHTLKDAARRAGLTVRNILERGKHVPITCKSHDRD